MINNMDAMKLFNRLDTTEHQSAQSKIKRKKEKEKNSLVSGPCLPDFLEADHSEPKIDKEHKGSLNYPLIV